MYFVCNLIYNSVITEYGKNYENNEINILKQCRTLGNKKIRRSIVVKYLKVIKLNDFFFSYWFTNYIKDTNMLVNSNS